MIYRRFLLVFVSGSALFFLVIFIPSLGYVAIHNNWQQASNQWSAAGFTFFWFPSFGLPQYNSTIVEMFLLLFSWSEYSFLEAERMGHIGEMVQ
jgi:hypothetical protein